MRAIRTECWPGKGDAWYSEWTWDEFQKVSIWMEKNHRNAVSCRWYIHLSGWYKQNAAVTMAIRIGVGGESFDRYICRPCVWRDI